MRRGEDFGKKVENLRALEEFIFLLNRKSFQNMCWRRIF